MCGDLGSNWRKILGSNVIHSKRCNLSPALYAQCQVLEPLLLRYLYGCCIDLGCGDMPFASLIRQQVDVYHTLDLFPKSEHITYTGNIMDMSMIEDESYDSAVCLEVLEHVPDPFRAVHEIHRILKPQGIIVVSVPHLNRLHEIPYDYYRFTSYGLRFLFESNGFEVVDLQKKGGLFSFLGHQLSIAWLSLFGEIIGLGYLAGLLNAWFMVRLPWKIDKLIDRKGLFALGYVAVMRKVTEDRS